MNLNKWQSSTNVSEMVKISHTVQVHSCEHARHLKSISALKYRNRCNNNNFADNGEIVVGSVHLGIMIDVCHVCASHAIVVCRQNCKRTSDSRLAYAGPPFT